MFPILCPESFTALVHERRPRALTILAHFFGLLSRFRDIWWIGNTGRREVLAIQANLPQEWQHFIGEPLKVIEQESILVD